MRLQPDCRRWGEGRCPDKGKQWANSANKHACTRIRSEWSGTDCVLCVGFACTPQELIRRQQDIENAKRLYKGDGNEDMPNEI